MTSQPKSSKRVRFSRKNETCEIERRGHTHQRVHDEPVFVQPSDPTQLDDEVKDHPIFAPPVPILDTRKSNEIVQSIQSQLQQHPECTSIKNPATGRMITRFGTKYWTLLQTLGGQNSRLFQQEKSEYQKKYKKT